MGSLGGPEMQNYRDFQTKWKEEQVRQTEELRRALSANLPEDQLEELVHTVERHYESYYEKKDRAVSKDVITMMQPGWKSPLENAFMWIGGWRPTMVFQLAYAQAGHQLETELTDFLRGLDATSLASLTSKQLHKISDLQVSTQKSEDEISHREAILQQGLADQPLLTLATAELAGEHSEGQAHRGSLSDAIDENVKALEDLCHDADSLRFETLKKMLEIFSPVQAAQYLVAAAQLQIAVRKIGQERQGNNGRNGGAGNRGRNEDED